MTLTLVSGQINDLMCASEKALLFTEHISIFFNFSFLKIMQWIFLYTCLFCDFVFSSSQHYVKKYPHYCFTFVIVAANCYPRRDLAPSRRGLVLVKSYHVLLLVRYHLRRSRPSRTLLRFANCMAVFISACIRRHLLNRVLVR